MTLDQTTELLRNLLALVESGHHASLVVGRYFETDEGSVDLSKEQAVGVLRALLQERAKNV